MSTLTRPTNLRINDGTSHTGSTARLSWMPAIGSGASGPVRYTVLINDGETIAVSDITETYYTIEASFWGAGATNFTCKVTVCAHYDIWDTYSDNVYFTFQSASLTNPTNLRVNGGTSYTGSTAVLTWTAATGTGASGSVLYDVLINDGEAIAVSGIPGTSYTIPATYWEGTPSNTSRKLTIAAKYSDLRTFSNSVTYIYQPQNTLRVRSGENWISCIPHYFNGTSWVACIPYYRQNTSWVECNNG